MHPEAGYRSLTSVNGETSATFYWFTGILVTATFCRLLIATILPFGVDEAYAVGVARQFSLSYFDHPPLHFWVVGLWAKVWGSENMLLLRLPFILLSAVSTWLMFDLGARLFGERAGIWAAAIFNLVPVFGVVDATLVLPDGPLICAGLGLANVMSRILFEESDRDQTGRWLIAGALAGLAMLSKYHGLLMVGGVLLFLLSSPGHRHWLRRPGPWLAAFVALLIFLPVLIWNAQHEWASFGFQAGRNNWKGTPTLANAARSLLAQSLYLLPWVAIPLAAVLAGGAVGGPRSDRRWLLVCLALPPILLFTGAASLGRGLAHWPMPGWLFAIPLLAGFLADLRPIYRKAAGVVALVTAASLTAFIGVVVAQSRWGTFDSQVHALFASDPTDILKPWDGLREELSARGLPAEQHTFIAAFNWIRAAELNAVFGRDIPVLCICRDDRHFGYLNPPVDFAGWTGILIDHPGSVTNEKRVAPLFGSLTTPEDVSLQKAGRVAEPLLLRVGTDFRPPPP